jgi:hypothetical protein
MKLPYSSRNMLSLIGSVIVIANLALIILLFIISLIFDLSDSFVGVFIYLILPGFLLMGLIVMLIGMIVRKKKLVNAPEAEKARMPIVNLNEKDTRKAFVVFTIGTVVVLFLATYSGFEAYHYSESVKFCGTLCHEVMEPEHVAYQNSPHANVLCVECHVGAGASWYVKSKLSGLHQVYAVLTNDYSKPIETPLHDLRPARETCERCHWPQKFYPRSVETIRSFLADSLNTEWDIMLQMKTGPEYTDLGFKEGIHWHINPSVNIEYISENDKRENITWVKYTNKETGEVNIYRNPDNPVNDSTLATSEVRMMDCIDCHNRPSHRYNSPPVYFDKAMLTGEISSDIPFIKKTAMEVLRQTFTNKDTALMTIRDQITNFYKTGYSDFYAANTAKIDSSISAIQKAFSINTFPRMKVSYDVYPNHVGHLEYEGCFRCHNNAFVSESGRKITRDCNVCHSIVGQGKPGKMQFTNVRDTLGFQHPIDIGTAWKEANCSECHRNLY